MTELDIPLQQLVPEIEKQPAGKNIMDAYTLRQTLLGDVLDSEGNSYDLDTDPEGGIWHNVSEHTIAAMYIVDTLGEKLGLSTKERATLTQAALLHDSSKKTEQLWLRHIDATNPKDTTKRTNKARAALEAIASMEDSENTLDLGIPPEVSSLMHSNIPNPDREQTLSEKVMWFGDAILQGIKRDGILYQNIVTVTQRFDELEKNPKSVAFSKLFIPDYGKPLFDVQREYGATYEKEFSDKLNMTVEEMYTWLQTNVKERIASGTVPNLEI